LFALNQEKMRAAVFVFLLAVIGAKAGCEWYQNCGACVADSGCGWCSNDPAGVGSGSIESTTGSDGKQFKNVKNDGSAGDISAQRSDTQSENGVEVQWLVNVRGQYERIAATSTSNGAGFANLASHFDFEGTGYVASPYFGQTWGGADRFKSLVGVHKTKFTKELKATYTVTPYTKSTYTVSSVQSDTQATLTSAWTETFNNIEFQIGNIPVSGTISYPDTSKQDVYGSWPPNPSKFTTELKDGYTIQCSGSTGAGGSCGGTNVRVKHIYNDQHLYVDPRFTTTFHNRAFKIEMGPRGTGLVSGTATQQRLEGSDPCKVANNEACYENTRFLAELRIGDRIAINANRTGDTQQRTVHAIQDDAHLELDQALTEKLNTESKFKIKTFHSSPFTYARKADGGLAGVTGTNSLKIMGYNSSTFTKNLMAGYAIIVKVPGTGANPAMYQKRNVVSIESETSLTIDSPFTAAFGTFVDASPVTYYNYESCPSLTYENFDLRTENGHGVITSLGVNLVYDNVQYSKITTAAYAGANVNSGKAAVFMKHLKVGYLLTMDSKTRTVTKIVSDTLLHVDRAFSENVEYRDYSYRYSVRKTGDYFFHWKPATETGTYHEMANATDAMIYSRNMIATTANGKQINSANKRKQNEYLAYPPVCYNTGRCVPKSSHSLVGVESIQESVKILSSTLPHQAVVANYVQLRGSTLNGDEYLTNCKPTCTIMVMKSDLTQAETRRVSRKVNSTFIQTTNVFRLPVGADDFVGRVRYVTGTGTVTASSSSRAITGASKETKTKFNSEFASGWTITIGCGGATCAGSSCTIDGDCNVRSKPTGGKCTANVCTAETKNITAVKSDTQLETTAAFTNAYAKVDYTIGMIPGLGYITSSQSSKIVDGNDNTRFLEQLKVNYTITWGTQTRTIHAIISNKLLQIHTAFDTPGITTPASYKFSGKKGTGEVIVSTDTPKIVNGTQDVTQTQFQNELALGYLFMLGTDYKVVTAITSNTRLDVDKAFGKTYSKDDYNYESCWLSLGNEGGVATSSQSADLTQYTNKKVYVEDACEIKPGCCGFKVSSVVFPDRFAYYKIRPPHTNMNIRVVVKTTEDNVDLVVKKSAVPTTSSYDFKSVRESNPWALTVPQERITCPAFIGSSEQHAPNNCDYWYIGVRGDNRYPQKTGASEYDLYVYTEFDWPNFLCSDAKPDQGLNKCKWLGVMKNEDANMAFNDDSQAVMRLTPAVAQTKGSMFYSTKVHLYDGFETSFQFRMTGFTVGCNSVLYPSGFCGGGDGFAFVIQKHDDKQIGCTGAALGYAKADANKQGNDWARHRCTSVSADADGTAPALDPGNPTYPATCDQDDDGNFGDVCIQGSLCQVTGARNGGCGTSGACGFQSCDAAIGQVLAVEFDTWNNLKLHDPKQGVSRWWINATEFVGYNDNHVAIFSSNLPGGLESDHALNEHFAATPSIPNLADGKNHTVKIKYWPQLNDPGKETDGTYNRTNLKLRGKGHNTVVPTCGDCEDTNSPTKYPAPDHCYPCKTRNNRPGNFAVFIDDMKRPVLQTAISLRKHASCYDQDRDRCVLDEIGNAYIGFTAATGGERAQGRSSKGAHLSYVSGLSGAAAENAGKMLGAAQNHEILNWKFCNQIGCVPI